MISKNYDDFTENFPYKFDEWLNLNQLSSYHHKRNSLLVKAAREGRGERGGALGDPKENWPAKYKTYAGIKLHHSSQYLNM